MFSGIGRVVGPQTGGRNGNRGIGVRTVGNARKQTPGFGKAIARARFGQRTKAAPKFGDRHSVNDADDDDMAHDKNMQSILEANALDEFLSYAQLSGRDFSATHERATIIVVGQEDYYMRELGTKAKRPSADLQLRIPRKPAWTYEMTRSELVSREKEAFLDWRRKLAQVEEEGHVMTPFEKNIEVWRQLWRVVEKSALLVQIVDARNPMLFRCRDLETYVNEVDPNKRNFLIINKADFLSKEQREAWVAYFQAEGTEFAFFSAKSHLDAEEQARIARQKELERQRLEGPDVVIDEDVEDDDDDDDEEGEDGEDEVEEENEDDGGEAEEEKIGESDLAEEDGAAGSSSELPADFVPLQNNDGTLPGDPMHVYDPLELLELLLSKAPVPVRAAAAAAAAASSSSAQDGEASEAARVLPLIIGLVGYPNVGKSSTINALCGAKRVAVSSTPGKTKHFQTIILDPEITLCDCPGLVFPTIMSTKADLVCNGILPIDRLREPIQPVALVCQRVDRHTLDRFYGLSTFADSGEFPGIDDEHYSARELLRKHARARGYLKKLGEADESRSARVILKDFVDGKLLYAYWPPNKSTDANADSTMSAALTSASMSK
nr:large subunit GTPase 1 [Seculamonas ecuadoriensis]